MGIIMRLVHVNFVVTFFERLFCSFVFVLNSLGGLSDYVAARRRVSDYFPLLQNNSLICRPVTTLFCFPLW